jgi:hypothetical protein
MTRPESASPRSPARWLSVLAAATALGGCTAETEGLEVPDAALVVCEQPTDCAGSLPVCEDPSRCGCGTFRTCVEGQCRVVAVDCVGDGGATDATAPDAIAPGGPDAATLDGTAPGSCTMAMSAPSGSRTVISSAGMRARPPSIAWPTAPPSTLPPIAPIVAPLPWPIALPTTPPMAAPASVPTPLASRSSATSRTNSTTAMRTVCSRSASLRL